MWGEFESGRALVLRPRSGEDQLGVVVTERISASRTSVVYKVTGPGNAALVLKVFHASHSVGASTLEDSLIQDALDRDREAEALERIGGSVAPSLVAVGEVGFPEEESTSTAPAILMGFVEGVTLGDWALTNFSFEQRFNVLLEVARALDVVHDLGVLQIDVADRNVLVRADGKVTLIDFNASKVVRSMEAGLRETTLGRLRSLVNIPAGHPLSGATITYDDLGRFGLPALDLIGFGQLAEQLLSGQLESIPLRSRRSIEYLVRDLTDWETLQAWPKGKLGVGWMRCAHGIDRLPELAPPSKNHKSIALPGGFTASITSRLDDLIGTPQFFRLAQLRQLSMVDYIYPGATHSRRTHLLHSLEISRQLVNQLKDSPPFEVNFGSDDALRLLVTCLLHDLNHFPFLHNIQEAVGDALPNRDVLEIVCDEDHYPSNSGADSFAPALHAVGMDLDHLYRLCFDRHNRQSSPSDEVISSVVNSGVDVDKISYLLLDGHATGVAYASGLDLSTLLKAATVARLPQSTRLHLAFEDRALQAMEHVYLTRLWNFRSIYWHHTNRALMAMVGSVAGRLFSEADDPLGLFTEFFRATMWGGEPVATWWLAERFSTQFPRRHNPIENLGLDRQRIFKRLYTVRPELGGEDREIYSTIATRLLPLRGSAYVEAEAMLKTAIASHLAAELGGLGLQGIDPDLDLLIDVPRRKLDEGGDSYVLRPDGTAMPLSEASSIVSHIAEDYEKLAKRVRVFISPRFASKLPTRFRVDLRYRLQAVVAQAVESLPLAVEGPK